MTDQQMDAVIQALQKKMTSKQPEKKKELAGSLLRLESLHNVIKIV